MPRKPKVPSFCLNKASGRAVVRINGHDHYLGQYGSDDSHAEYARLIAEWRTNRQAFNDTVAEASRILQPSLTVSELVLRYREFAKSYYSKDGKPGKEYIEMRMALKPLRKLYGQTPARSWNS